MGKMRLRRGFTAVALTLLVIMLLALGVAGTVSGQSEKSVELTENAYVELEGEYVRQLRTILNEEGYKNCGVNLTRVVDGEGNRAYNIVLHHKYLDKLSVEELQILFVLLSEDAFQFANCSFSFAAE